MTFGGTPCPSMWGYISDTIVDVSKNIIHNEFWDPSLLHDELSASLEAPLSLPDTIPFHPAQKLSVDLLTNNIGKVDAYTDDSVGIALDSQDNARQVSDSIPLAIHSMSRAKNPLGHIPWNDVISLKKLLAEGFIEESKFVLDWEQNTRSISISLPSDKHRNWTLQISTMISAKHVSFKELEIVIGRMNHCATILPAMHHFLGRIHQVIYRSKASNWTCLLVFAPRRSQIYTSLVRF